MSYDNLSSVSQNVLKFYQPSKLLIKFQNILRNATQVIIRHRVKILFSVISSPITLEQQKWKLSKMKEILLPELLDLIWWKIGFLPYVVTGTCGQDPMLLPFSFFFFFFFFFKMLPPPPFFFFFFKILNFFKKITFLKIFAFFIH
jgi:hypothetical protein